MSADTTGTDTPDPRDVRAATEAMVVVREAPGMYRVYSGESSTYVVDAIDGACQCEDFRFRWDENGRACKHCRRVEMTLGKRPIPDGVTPDPVLVRQLHSAINGGL